MTWLFLDRPHADFIVTAESVVEVSYPPPPDQDPVLGKDPSRPRSDPRRERRRNIGSIARWPPAIAETRDFARTSFRKGRPILEALNDLNNRIYKEFRFRSGVTTISTPVTQVMKRREGVCQDFTHLMVSALCGGWVCRRGSEFRLHPDEAPTGEASTARGRPVGTCVGWGVAGAGTRLVDLDPTNGIVVKDEHVLLGWGRDFSDISPVRGVILGGGAHHLKVAVDLDPDDPPDLCSPATRSRWRRSNNHETKGGGISPPGRARPDRRHHPSSRRSTLIWTTLFC